MYCIKCGAHIPDDSKFCTVCGFNLREAEAKTVPEPSPKVPPVVPVQQQAPASQNTAPQYYSAPPSYEQASVPEKKGGMGKTAVVFLVLFVAALFGCLALLLNSTSLQAQNDEYKEKIGAYENEISAYRGQVEALERTKEAYKNEVSSLEKELEEITAERNELYDTVDIAEQVFELMASNDSWGYATENFHANKGIVFLDRFAGTQSIEIFATYYTTFHLEVSNTNVLDANWSDKEWTEKGTEVFMAPVDTGYCILTFTNDLYDTSFEVLVIVR